MVNKINDLDYKIRKALRENDKESLYKLMDEYINDRVKYAENVIFDGIKQQEYINIPH